MKKILSILTAAVLTLAATSAALAHGYRLGDLTITHPWARPTVSDRTPGAAYLVIRNRGRTDDRLIAVRPEDGFAEYAELHTHINDNGVFRMREMENGIPIPAGETVALRPGGLHVMLYGLDGPLTEGNVHGLTLVFERSGEITVGALVHVPELDEHGNAH